MKRVMGRRAESDALSPWLIGIVLLVVGAVIVGLIYYKFYGATSDTLANLPLSALTSAKAVCDLAIKAGDSGRTEFCSIPKKVSGNVWVTCDGLKSRGLSFEGAFNCGAVNEGVIKTFCKDKVLAGDGSASLEVNEKKCRDYVVCEGDVIGVVQIGLGGKLDTVNKDCSAYPDSKKIKKGFAEDGRGVCCV